jgi:transposase
MERIEQVGQAQPERTNPGSEPMRGPEEVAAMLELHRKGWGAKRIARELGVARNTVRRYLAVGDWQPYRVPSRASRLQGMEAWLAERFERHRGNADVIRQELEAEHGLVIGLRSVQRAVEPLRRLQRAEARATVRFETPPGRQLQIDFGEVRLMLPDIDPDTPTRVHLFVATLGYSRRMYIEAFLNERQASWFAGIEAAFRHFGGVPSEILLDNARALVIKHDRQTREVRFNPRLHAFCGYWKVRPHACAPFRARTKGKDERGVGYVKRNAIAGRRFESFEALRAHLTRWAREIADVRIHGTTGEAPAVRYERDERAALAPIDGRAPFVQIREVVRRVHTDACVELDTNRYSVPWRLIGEVVQVMAADGSVRIEHAGVEIARHGQLAGRRGASIERAHLIGVVGATPPLVPGPTPGATPQPERASELMRSLAEYEHAAGGAW